MKATPKNIQQKALKILSSNMKLRFHPEEFYQLLVGFYEWKKDHAIYATLRICSYLMFDYAGENVKELGPIKINRIKKFIKFTEEHTSYPQIMFRTFFHLSGLLRSKLRLIERMKIGNTPKGVLTDFTKDNNVTWDIPVYTQLKKNGLNKKLL